MAERTPWSLAGALKGMFQKPTIDETTWDDLEHALLSADFGPDVTEATLDDLHAKVDRYRTTDPRDLQRMLRESIEERLSKYDTTLKLSERPAVVLVVGVAERRSSGRSSRVRTRHPSRSRPSSSPNAPVWKSFSSTPPAGCRPRAA
jgi:hypothetical protein